MSDEIQIKLLIGNKFIICSLWKLQYKIPREKSKPEPGFEPQTLNQLSYSGSIASAGLNFSLEKQYYININ